MFNMIPLHVKLLVVMFGVVGAAGWGYMKGSAQAEIELANYRVSAEKQISDLKAENIRISDNITVEYVDRTNTIVQKEIVYKDVVKTLEPQQDLSNGWVHLHDAAAKLANPDMKLASDASPSGIMDTSALAVVMSNYAICKQNAEQLISLQRWITDNKAAIDEVSKKEE